MNPIQEKSLQGSGTIGTSTFSLPVGGNCMIQQRLMIPILYMVDKSTTGERQSNWLLNLMVLVSFGFLIC